MLQRFETGQFISLIKESTLLEKFLNQMVFWALAHSFVAANCAQILQMLEDEINSILNSN